MDDIAVRLRDVSKAYKIYNSPKDRLREAFSLSGKEYHEDFMALDGIDLEVCRGEVLGVLGRNGSGKSTLLKIIARILSPTTGSVEVNGKISAILELGGGFNPEFSGLQNIYFYATILGMSRAETTAKLDDIIDFADIGEFISQPVKIYSSGMKSRLSFAVAVNINPEILILDEVLAVGDEFFRRKCYAKMEELFNAGSTIFYVSHSRQSIIDLCSRAILLNDSHIISSGSPKDVCEHYKLLAMEPDNSRAKASRAVPVPSGDSGDVVLKHLLVSDMAGEQPLELDNGSDYRVSLQLQFKGDFAEVSVSLQLRTVEGYCVSGISLRGADKLLSNVTAGATYQLDYVLNCNLKEGSYFFDIGVNAGTRLVGRFMDAARIAVVNNGSRFGGVARLFQGVEVSKVN